MNLSAPFIHRPVMTTLVMLAILLVGIGAYFELPVSNMPNVEYPSINVTVVFPGANPETMANNVATPLEKEFLTIDGLVAATSNNTLGNTSIILQFNINKNLDAASTDVQAAIARALPNLPPQLPSAPTYRKVNPSLTPIIILALTSETDPLYTLYDYANVFIGQQLSLIEGVAEIVTYGSPYAVRVQVDPGKLAATGITLLDVSNSLVNGNPYLATGFFDNPINSPTILVKGQLLHADAYNPLIVSYVNNAPVRIQDLGKAIDSLQNFRFSLFYVDKNIKVPAVVLAILPQPGSNAVKISKDMHKLLPSILEQLPSSMNLRIVNDKTDAVEESIKDVQVTLLIAFVLVVMIIFIYLGKVKDTIIPALVLPMSVIGTFAIMYVLHFNIDNLSLLALILAIGFIIDDAIVVIENIVRHVEEGKSPWVAALDGSKQISFTILSMTMSLVAVFIPLLFMAGIIGKIVAEFAMTLTAITLLSGVISLTLTPMLCSLFIPRRTEKEKETFGHHMNQKMLDYYKPSLKWVLEHPLVALSALVISIVISVWLLIQLPKNFLPNDDIGFFIIYTQAAEGISYKNMMSLQEKIENIVRKHPDIEQFVSIASQPQFRNGILYIRLKPRNERKSVLKVIDELNKETSKIIGINSFYKNIPLIDLSLGAQVKGAYQYLMRALNPKLLYPAAYEFINKMATIPGIQGINSDLEISAPQLYVDIPRDKTYSLGINANDIETAFELSYSGGRVTRIQSPINQYDVILELQPEFQLDETALNSIFLRSTPPPNSPSLTSTASQASTSAPYIATPAPTPSTPSSTTASQLVPLSAVANWYMGIGPTSINHIPAVTVSYNLTTEASLSEVLEKLKKNASNILPSGVTGNPIGAAQTFQESIMSAIFLLIVTILAIYIVLGILYESYIHPITILTTLPPAILGGLLVLYIFNESLSFYSFLGIILLIGIVKKNGIMMVDFALDNIREKGESPEKSIYDACIVRFRPIMMTTLTAIVGAIPLTLGWGAGADARRPLGLVIICGLLVSQLITLYITPVIYLYMEKLNEKFILKSAEERSSDR
jgi:hydrophobic/amphiphilic exporter-1 (mainly G- bacteria), HAE1 family